MTSNMRVNTEGFNEAVLNEAVSDETRSIDDRMGVGQRRRRIISIAVALGAVAAVMWVLGSAGRNDSTARSPLLGQPAPAVVTTTTQGDKFDLARRKGSWVVFNFFNSTCVPCIAEHPALVSFVERESGRTDGAEFYSVINDDSTAAVDDFFARRGGEWPRLRDDDGAIAVAFGVAKVPETWVIDPNGFVRLRILGAVTSGDLEMRLDSLRGAS
jgi:cytochrome c biogenesis protein CcmG/thiol:disulfide interchange protein DsbE